MRTPLFLVAVASVLVSACSTTPPTRSTYLLRSSSNMESGPLAKVGNETLGEVKVANYIDQSGLVLELSDGMIHSAKQHHWAEPLRISLREFLSTEITAKTGRSLAAPSSSSTAIRIDVHISQLHGDAEGNAVLVAQWSLNSAKKRSESQFSKTMALEGVGYESLVVAEKQLLIQLSQAIASELK
jgi:uncharacterized lipoprotein YmbA